jgi:hypothetical protein
MRSVKSLVLKEAKVNARTALLGFILFSSTLFTTLTYAQTSDSQLVQETRRHDEMVELQGWSTVGAGFIGACWVLWRYQQDKQNALRLKALELAMAGRSPGAVCNKLKVIRAIIPQLRHDECLALPEASKLGFGTSIQRRQDLISILANSHETRRDGILEDWHALFPDDKWLAGSKGQYTLKG